MTHSFKRFEAKSKNYLFLYVSRIWLFIVSLTSKYVVILFPDETFLFPLQNSFLKIFLEKAFLRMKMVLQLSQNF
jgi:hypothetical protein